MHRLGGSGVNTQKHNKITPEVEKPPFLGLLKKDFTKQWECDIMSKSRANELLQDLHARLSANWKGREHFSTTQAVELCRAIVYEYDNDDSNRDNTADSVSDVGEQ